MHRLFAFAGSYLFSLGISLSVVFPSHLAAEAAPKLAATQSVAPEKAASTAFVGPSLLTPTSKYKTPSFVAGVCLLGVGLIAGVTAVVLQNRPCDCPPGAVPAWPVAYGISGVALASGTASMIYWGVKVNIP